MDPRHDPERRRQWKRAVRLQVVEEKRGVLTKKYARLLDRLEGVRTARLLMSDDAPVTEVEKFARQQIANGFGLPTKVVDLLRSLMDDPNTVIDVQEVVYELLKVAVAGIGGRRQFAWDMIGAYEERGWTPLRFEAAKSLLAEAKNGRRL